jgi:hypothetical protein
MARAKTRTAICTYRVKPELEARFVSILRRHWQTLHMLGLVSDTPSQIYRGLDEAKEPVYVEILEWKDSDAAHRAELFPQVLALWAPIAECCESRRSRPSMEFPHFELLRNVQAPTAPRAQAKASNVRSNRAKARRGKH